MEGEQSLEVVRRAVGQTQFDRIAATGAGLATPELARWLGVGSDESRVEATQTGIAGRSSNGGDGQTGFTEQLLGKQQPPRCRDIQRTRTELLIEQTAQMTLANTNARGEIRYSLAIAGQPRLFAGSRIERRMARFRSHGCNLAAIAAPDSPFSDINARATCR